MKRENSSKTVIPVKKSAKKPQIDTSDAPFSIESAPEQNSGNSAINSVNLDGILSSEVRGILKDLNLEEHLLPQNPTPQPTQKQASKPVKNVRKKSPREDAVREEPKRKHYDHNEVQRFMQK